MNHVADWARAQGLMDHTGDEAVPRAVSLFEAHLNQPSRVALLQQRDGYDSDHLEVGAELPAGYEPPLNVLAELLGRHRAVLDPRRGRRSRCWPARRGRSCSGRWSGSSSRARRATRCSRSSTGRSRSCCAAPTAPTSALGTRRDTVLGEMSLLTGEPRSATVRAVDGALVYEVGRRQLQPLLAARPELVDALQDAMVARLRDAAVAARALRRACGQRRSGAVSRRARARRRPRGARGSARRRRARARAGPPAAAASTPYSGGRTTAAARQANVRSAAVKRSPVRCARPSASRAAIASNSASTLARSSSRLLSSRWRRGPAVGERVEARSAPWPPRPGRPGCCT